MFTDRSRVKWIILSYCFIVMACSRTTTHTHTELNHKSTEWIRQMPTFCRSHSSLQLFHFSVEAIHWYLLFIFSLQFRFMLLLHCVCVCVSVWFFVFLLIGYVFLDECINRDVYFRVFDYFFVVVARVTQSILIIWKNGRARKHRQNHFTFDSMFVWFFLSLLSACKIPCRKKCLCVCWILVCIWPNDFTFLPFRGVPKTNQALCMPSAEWERESEFLFA